MDRAYVQSKKEGSERRVYAASFDCAQVVDGKLFVAAEREQPPDPEDEVRRPSQGPVARHQHPTSPVRCVAPSDTRCCCCRRHVRHASE